MLSRSEKLEVAAADSATLAAPEAIYSPSLAPALTPRLPFDAIEYGTLAVDFLIITCVCIASDFLYQRIVLGGPGDTGSALVISLLVFAYFCTLTSAQHNYRPTNLLNVGRQLRYVTLNWFFIFFILTAVAYGLKVGTEFSRGSNLTFLLLGWASLVSFRAILGRYLKHALAAGTFAEKKVLLISRRNELATSGALAELNRCGYHPVRTYEITSAEIESVGVSKSLKQKVQEIVSFCQADTVDYIFLLLKWDHQQVIKKIVQMLQPLPIPVHLLPDESVATFLSGRAGNIGKTLTIELQRAPLSKSEQALKRTFDVVFSLMMIILLSPLMLITALLIKLDSRGPILFRQKRNGFNGSVFSIYKFRSMRVLEDGDHIPQACRNDVRVTSIGRWIRRTSIDELPQFFNVLKGNMSIVGPRPHAVAHNNDYQKRVAKYAFRHHVKPGITGWAQVNGFRGETRSDELMAQRVECDLWYINHWSIWLDLRIVLKTFLLAYRQPAAY